MQVPPGAGSGQLPEWLTLAIWLFVAGAFVEVVYRVSPDAAYALVVLILLGYAASGANLANVVSFFRGLPVVTQSK